MRTDCTITRKAIICPNAKMLGFDKGYRAEIGDCILYQETEDTLRVARVLGCVSAPALEPGDAPVKNFALVMALSGDAGSGYERWVDPLKIVRIFSAPTKFAEFFFAPTLPYDAQTMRRLMEYGTINERYIDNASARVAGWTKEEGR